MITKFCKGCEKDLPLTDEYFASRTDRKEKEFQYLCRKCQKKYRREHYLNNKAKYIEKAKIFTQNMTDWFIELKKTLFCKKCGESRYWVLDFHHLDPKEKDLEVSTLVKQGNKKRILKEIKKCIVLCSNCHRDFHYHDNNS